MIAVVEHRGQVRGHALHPAGADRLDPRLLDRVEQRPRRGVLRRVSAVDRVIVAGEPQREGIGEPAKDRRLARVGLARRLRQPGLRPLRPGDERRLVGGKGDLELRMARHRAGARDERPLERLVRLIRFRRGLAVAGRLDVDARHGNLLWRRPLVTGVNLSIGRARGPRQGDGRSTRPWDSGFPPAPDAGRPGRSAIDGMEAHVR